jgi:hypothetical protein
MVMRLWRKFSGSIKISLPQEFLGAFLQARQLCGDGEVF